MKTLPFFCTGLLILLTLQTVVSTTDLEDGRGARNAAEQRTPSVVTTTPPLSAVDPCTLPEVICNNEIYATITGFNTVPGQTDSSPCIAASGENICGRTDVAACPTVYPFGTVISILGQQYRCVDHTATKYNGRFDISFDKDVSAAQTFGKKEAWVMVYE